MHKRRGVPVGTLVMVLIVGLALIGVGYGLWSQSLFIKDTINTGNVSARFVGAFTDDDGRVDDPALDAGDTPNCAIQAGGNSSCDPAASGRDPKARYDKDVAQCLATVGDGTTATITKNRAYPGYFCTSWFDIANNGTVPVKIASATVNGVAVTPSVPTPFDLDNADGDNNNSTGADVAVHLTTINICQQIDPGKQVRMDVDQQVLQAAPQNQTLTYTVEIKLQQWNEPCTPVIAQLPVFNVSSVGISPEQATQLAGALGIPAADIQVEGGTAHYVDPVNFQAVPVLPVADFSQDGTEVDDARSKIVGEAFNFDAINKIVPFDGGQATDKVQSAFKAVGLTPANGLAGVQHTLFRAADLEGNFLVEGAQIDTNVAYNFMLANVPAIGPGMQVNVAYSPAGQVTQLLYASHGLAEGEQTPIILPDAATERCQALYPGLDAQVSPSLAYYVPPTELGANMIVPHYECRGTTQVGRNQQAILLQQLIPAVDDPKFVPSVELSASFDGKSVMAMAEVTGGRAPYTYHWTSSSADLSGIAESQASINYEIGPRTNSGAALGVQTAPTETVKVVVVDANGIQVQETTTVALTGGVETAALLFGAFPELSSAVPKLFRPVGIGGVVDFGIERAVSDMCSANVNRYSDRMDNEATKQFHWTGLSAWERDFKHSTDHNNYVDNVDQTFYCGHGWGGGFTFESNQDDGALEYPDPRISAGGDWGDKDLEFMAILSCQVLKWEHDGLNHFQRWGPAFDGLHLMLGFDTNAYDWSNFGKRFAQWQLGRFFGIAPVLPVRAAWFQAAMEEQPSGVKAVVMGVFGPGGLTSYNDYFWGNGPVSPDLRGSNINGFWSVTKTVP